MELPSKRVEVIPAKRRAVILEHLRANGAVSIQELAEALGASLSTIRRDLEQLTETGYLERTHGGALLVPPFRSTFEGEGQINALMNRQEKQAIGAEAAKRLSARDSVLFDSSSTVLEAVRASAQNPMPLTIVTDSLAIATACAAVPAWRVIMTGGTLRQGQTMLIGEPGEDFVKKIHADICFMGTYAITSGLLTDAALEVASMKRTMIRSANRRILLVDSSKFRTPAFCTFGNLSEFHEIITDEGIKPEHLDSLQSFEVKVTVVKCRP